MFNKFVWGGTIALFGSLHRVCLWDVELAWLYCINISCSPWCRVWRISWTVSIFHIWRKHNLRIHGSASHRTPVVSILLDEITFVLAHDDRVCLRFIYTNELYFVWFMRYVVFLLLLAFFNGVFTALLAGLFVPFISWS